MGAWVSVQEGGGPKGMKDNVDSEALVETFWLLAGDCCELTRLPQDMLGPSPFYLGMSDLFRNGLQAGAFVEVIVGQLV